MQKGQICAYYLRQNGLVHNGNYYLGYNLIAVYGSKVLYLNIPGATVVCFTIFMFHVSIICRLYDEVPGKFSSIVSPVSAT